MKRDIIQPGRVAVITGAAAGLGAALARRLSATGMRLCLLDREGESLHALADELGGEVSCIVGDVTDAEALHRLRRCAFEVYGDLALLVNNAGVTRGAGPWGDLDAWRYQMEVNFFSVVAAQQLFVPSMLSRPVTSAIVNLGSKEGITTPPGNAAYSVAKAGVKVLTEQLAHELRRQVGERITAHLLVPGYTWTPMNFPGMDPAVDTKPQEPWTADQVIDLFLARFDESDFYILCPDNVVTPAIDAKRIQWAYDDLIHNRPALSRWHPAWKDRFEAWMHAR